MSKKEKKQKNVTSKTKGGIGIREQMMIKLLPVTILATVLLTVVSAVNSKNTINSQVQDTMTAELSGNSAQINADLDTVRHQCANLAREVGMHYERTSMEEFGRSFGDAIRDSDIINGAGIWLSHMHMMQLSSIWDHTGTKMEMQLLKHMNIVMLSTIISLRNIM